MRASITALLAIQTTSRHKKSGHARGVPVRQVQNKSNNEAASAVQDCFCSQFLILESTVFDCPILHSVVQWLYKIFASHRR